MNLQAQHSWWLTFSRFQKSRETTWGPVIYKALCKQVQPTITILKEQGLNAAIAQYAFHVPMDGIATVVKNIYTDAGRIFGGRTYQMIKQQVEKLNAKKSLAIAGYDEELQIEQKRLTPVGFNEEMVNAIIEHYRLFLLTKAVIPISETTKQFILDTLIQAQQEGWSIQMIVDKLENSDLARNRARTIARTETGKASSFAAITAARKTGYLQNKIWIAAKDFRTRRIASGGQHEHDTFDHYNMNGVMVGLDEPFQVPAKTGGYELMSHPHDPNGSAGDVIRCRCTIGFKILTDHAGRPLRS